MKYFLVASVSSALTKKMKHLNCKYYVEVKKEKNIFLSKLNLLRERKERKSLRTQNQVMNEEQIKTK